MQDCIKINKINTGTGMWFSGIAVWNKDICAVVFLKRTMDPGDSWLPACRSSPFRVKSRESIFSWRTTKTEPFAGFLSEIIKTNLNTGRAYPWCWESMTLLLSTWPISLGCGCGLIVGFPRFRRSIWRPGSTLFPSTLCSALPCSGSCGSVAACGGLPASQNWFGWSLARWSRRFFTLWQSLWYFCVCRSPIIW